MFDRNPDHLEKSCRERKMAKRICKNCADYIPEAKACIQTCLPVHEDDTCEIFEDKDE